MKEAVLQMTFFAALLYDEKKRCSLLHSIYNFRHEKWLWNARDILTDFLIIK